MPLRVLRSYFLSITVVLPPHQSGRTPHSTGAGECHHILTSVTFIWKALFPEKLVVKVYPSPFTPSWLALLWSLYMLYERTEKYMTQNEVLLGSTFIMVEQ